MFVTACPEGTYKNYSGPGDKSTCYPCPDPHHTSPKGSVSELQCRCGTGYQPSSIPGVKTCAGDDDNLEVIRPPVTKTSSTETPDGNPWYSRIMKRVRRAVETVIDSVPEESNLNCERGLQLRQNFVNEQIHK